MTRQRLLGAVPRMDRLALVLATAVCATSAAGCQTARERTEILVVVDASPGVRSGSASIDFLVRGAAAATPAVLTDGTHTSLGGAALVWPASLGIVPDGDDATRRFDITIEARRANDSALVTAHVVGGFVAGETRVLNIFLEDACISHECSGPMTCRAGNCVTAVVDTHMLPVYGSDAGPTDAGMDSARTDAQPDAHTTDAFVVPDVFVMPDMGMDAFVVPDDMGNDAYDPPDMGNDAYEPPDMGMDMFVPPDMGNDAFVLPDMGNDAFVPPPDAYVPTECIGGRLFQNPITVGGGPGFWVQSADMNNDGNNDIVVALATTPGTVARLAGNGDGSFGPAVTVGSDIYNPFLIDIDHDGLRDIIADNNSSSVTVYRNLGSLMFSAGSMVTTTLTGGALGMAAGDMNADGTVDVLIGSGAFVSTNNAAFISSVTVTGGGTSMLRSVGGGSSKGWGAAIGDLDHAGGLDAVLAEFAFSTGTVSVTVNTATGPRAMATYVAPSGAYPISVRLGDVNADGWDDIVTGLWATGAVGVLINNHDGTFAAMRVTSLGFTSCNASSGCLWDVAVADFNGDGRADVAIPGINDASVVVLTANTSGQYNAPITERATFAGSHPQGITSADLNHDTRPDLIVVDNSSGPIRVLLHCP